jgi:hypothetical protein
MKKAIASIVIVLCTLTSYAQAHKEYFDNGTLKVAGTKTNGVDTGLWNYYFENGKISKTGNYTNGKLDGLWKYYYDTGVLRIIGKYKNGKDLGLWKYYHNNGALRAIGDYTNGKQTGLWKYYHKNKTLRKVGVKEEGVDVGNWKFYDEKGTLVKTEIKIDDKKEITAKINLYFEGSRTDNPALLRKAFHQNATVKYLNGKGDYAEMAIEKFFSYFTNTKTRSFVSKIYYIDVAGATANVKLSTKYKTYQYVDYMNMIKTKDGWRIVSKISHKELF